jgi:hypothetical protein
MKYLTLILTVLLTLSLNAFAGIGGWNPPGPPSSGGSGDSNSEAKATSTNFNTNLNNAHSSSNSSSSQGQGQQQGQIATGGNQSQTSKSKVKDSGNSEQAQSADNDNNISYSSSHDATEATASSAASISSMVCQNGASGQSKDYGVSFLTDSVYCNILKQASVERGLAKITLDATERAKHYDNAHYFDKKAKEYIEVTTATGTIASIALHAGQILLVGSLFGVILF